MRGFGFGNNGKNIITNYRAKETDRPRVARDRPPIYVRICQFAGW